MMELAAVQPELRQAAEPFVHPVPAGSVKVLPRWAEEDRVSRWRLRYRQREADEEDREGAEGNKSDGKRWVELEMRPFTRELPLTGLAHGVDHYFKVAIETKDGWSDWSAVVKCQPPSPEPPGKCAAVFVTVADNTTAVVRWTRPIDYAAASSCGLLTRYQLRVTWPPCEDGTEGGCHDITIAEDVDSFEVGDLVCCRDYQFQVRCENTSGWGDWSDPSIVIKMPLPVPAPPPQPSLRRATHHTAVIQWQHPDPGGAPIQSFRFRYTTSSDWSHSVEEGGDVGHNLSQYTITGLLPGSTYLFQVCAVNKYGMSVWSNSSIPMKTVDGQAPSRIKDLQVPNIYNSFITLQWPPAEDNGFEVSDHTVQHSYSPDMTDPIIDRSPIRKQGNFQTCSIHHLEKGKTYYFQVAAANKMGVSDWSEPVKIEMPKSGAPALKDGGA